VLWLILLVRLAGFFFPSSEF